MHVVLVSTYELGRQPFGLASPAAWLRQNGFDVTCQDLAVENLDRGAIATAGLVCCYVPMHTATRLAAKVLQRVRSINAAAALCCYGLYAPLNSEYLRGLGASTILGGEFENGLVELATQLAARTNGDPLPARTLVSLDRQEFAVPDRSDLPGLEQYAQLRVGSEQKLVGYTEASRGCKHLCRHCPIVPVYGGAFRIVQPQVALADIRHQVARGAQHITFGDPDFFNGPTHSLRIVDSLHREFPDLTYDVTIKVEHLLQHRCHLTKLRDTGCLFVTCAVESVDDDVLCRLAKNHTRQDFFEVVDLAHQMGIVLNPTFMAFTPWTSAAGYIDLLHVVENLGLQDFVAPVQYAIRLLITRGSRLLELEDIRCRVGAFDEEKLVYPWCHPNPRMDSLQRRLLGVIDRAQCENASRREIFDLVRNATSHCLGVEASCDRRDQDSASPAVTIPYLTEPWYC